MKHVAMKHVAIAAVLFEVCVGVSAHELGHTQVRVDFRPDGAYQIDVIVDPDALLARVEVATGAEISGSDLVPAERDKRIVATADAFLDGIDLRFDGERQRLTLEYLPAAAESPESPAIVRLAGLLPAGATEWSFSYAFAMGWYALEVRNGEAPPETIWLQGGKPASPLAIRGPSRQIEQRRLPGKLAPQIVQRIFPVFVLGLLLARLRKR